jgi:3-methylfumaryl-CoA hydratase
MAATVDHFAADRIRDGEALPALWHWIYFLEAAPARELGRDGHPARGAFLPPVPLANRMWAGGRVRFLAPVIIGATARRKSTVLRVDHKVGRTGDLVFVTVLHEIESAAGEPLVREEHDIVYKDRSPAATAGTVATDAKPAPSSQFSRSCAPTSTTLFRYSALTFNGHRIHYDADYCRAVEGYPNLVVHGPLIATLLAGFAEEKAGRPLRDFGYRALSPAFLGATLTLHADVQGGRIGLHATLDDGRVGMQAEAEAG